jgi:hypothetical protein
VNIRKKVANWHVEFYGEKVYCCVEPEEISKNFQYAGEIFSLLTKLVNFFLCNVVFAVSENVARTVQY